MLPIDKETFSYWVTHPDDLSSTDFVQLQESLQTYPYCQALHTLTAKAASIHLKGQTVPFTRQAAAHALSRNALRKLIDNEFQWSENLLTKLNELSTKHVPIPEDYQQESYALFKSKAGLSGGFPKMPLIRLPEPAQSENETIPTPEDPTLTETALQKDLAQIAEPVAVEPAPAPVDLERKRQFDLIEDFIKKEPRISPVRAKINEPVDQEDLTKRSKPTGGGLVTESFAKILAKQGKLDKAREIYEQLIVKNPEKKAYFAAKISELSSAASESSDS
ncbi:MULTISPECIES: hypothetical protein [Spirosoma]|uniref:Tetratricopeptide repeat protein n=1 Tax=Spirosoma liriopis TaxID=2937440 RepID=A0ABT0HPU3_9BACT|nr:MULTISPECIES: hypothetical protein [Spirosoma]MCK8494194.1 hypothetical protein [Spirosoma liriopis]UHG89207.1 hypothetical protein LQ777_13235 [Spirosoma oryzicola]